MNPKGRTCEDLTGRKFGRWTVLYRAPNVMEPRGREAIVWHCRCECGTERDVKAGSLKSGQSKSCGCLKSDVLRVNRNFGGKDQFERQMSNDSIKRLYAEEHGIPLIELPYTIRTHQQISDFLDFHLSKILATDEE